MKNDTIIRSTRINGKTLAERFHEQIDRALEGAPKEETKSAPAVDTTQPQELKEWPEGTPQEVSMR